MLIITFYQQMKKLILLFLISITMNNNLSAQQLTERQKNLGTIACLEAQGDLARLEPAISKALDAGVTINEIKEAFSQLYAYTGFPRSLNALGVLQKVIKDKKPEWKEGEAWVMPSEWNDAKASLELGTQNQTQLGGGRAFNYTFCPQDDYYLKAHLFGDIFAGNTLNKQDRELVTVAALSGLKNVAPQLAAHKAGAVCMGNTKEQVDELCQYLSAEGLSQCDNAADANAGSWPKGNPNVNYAQYFIGDSHLAAIKPVNLTGDEKTVLPMSNVTFEPGCRNNWHIHHGARQVLICVSGEGIYQEWGKAAIHLQPGDVVDIPEGVKHWHGATKDSWFQHIATHIAVENTKPGSAPNEWLEPVDDAQYETANK